MAPKQVALTHVYGEHMNSKILYPTLVAAWLVAAGFTSPPPVDGDVGGSVADSATGTPLPGGEGRILRGRNTIAATTTEDRKSTRLNSSHGYISDAVFCL